jgi:hypothetical protein
MVAIAFANTVFPTNVLAKCSVAEAKARHALSDIP